MGLLQCNSSLFPFHPSFRLNLLRAMMSSISPVFSSEPVLASHVPVLASGFTPWDAQNLFSIFDDSPLCPVEANPGLENRNSCQIQNHTYPNPGLNVVLTGKDDRRKKRKKSNRESAQRSRMKKQRHLEDVISQLNQLKIENQELENRFRYIMHHCQHAKMENDRLRLEHHSLHEKLLNLRQTLALRQIQQSSTCATWSCINSTVVTVHKNPSIIRDRVI